MATGEIVSQAKFFVNGASIGNFQLKRVESASFDDETDAEIVTAIGVQGGAGYRFKEGGGEISLEVFEEQGTPEVNWFQQKLMRKPFAFTVQYVGGQRFQFRGVIVAQEPRKSDSQGSHMRTVKLKFLSVVQLPSA